MANRHGEVRCSLIVCFHWQPDWMQNHQGNTAMGVSAVGAVDGRPVLTVGCAPLQEVGFETE